MASTSGKDNAVMSSGDFVKDSSSILSLQPWIFMKGNSHGGEEKLKIHKTYSDPSQLGQNCFEEKSYGEIVPRSVRLGFRHPRSQNSLSTRRACRYSLKSISPIKSSLISQWHDGKLGVEDYVFTAVPASTAYARPLVIFDGSRTISRSSFHQPAGESFESAIEEEVAGGTSNFVDEWSDASHRPRLRTPKRKSRETPHEKLDTSSTRRSRKTFDFKDGHDAIHIFSVGLAIGIISTILLNRKEVQNLNDLLRSKENLIQDLQEDLDKEFLMVKELDNEAGNQNTDGANARMEVHFESSENNISVSYIPTMLRNVQQAPMIPEIESMSEMEEELKAELERLALNINDSCPDEKMSVIELDPDLMVDVVHGELKVDALSNRAQFDGDNSDIDSLSTSTNHRYNANYVVSPRELSVRLHEVIQFRLEERINELEQTLQQSQKQLEAERNYSMRAFSGSDIGSSSNQGSPTSARDHTFTQPFCLNLHGDAVHAYEEAYEEFMRIADEESLQLTANTSNQSDYSLYSSDRSLAWGMEGEKCFKGDLTSDQLDKDSSLHLQEYLKKDEDECDEQYDDECKKLVQQILERTKQGSAAVMHAQRMLFSMDK